MAAPDPWQLVATGRHAEAGRLFEAQSRLQEAVQAYRRGAVWDEAARLLASMQQFEDAADCLLQLLPNRPTPVAELTPAQRRAASNAGLLYARSGRLRVAVGLLQGVGDSERAAEILRRSGRQADAVQAMRGQHLPDSPWPPGVLSNNLYTREEDPTTTGSVRRDPFELAERYARSERPEEALDTLLELPFDHPRYAEAVARAIRLVNTHGLMSLKVDQFVAPFIRGQGREDGSPVHAPTLYTLGRLYEKFELNTEARDAYDAVTRIDPDYRDARERRRALVQLGTLSDIDLEKVVDEDGSWNEPLRRRRRSTGDELPPLPEAPPLPKAPPLPDLPPLSDAATRPVQRLAEDDDQPSVQVMVDSRSLELGLGPLGAGSMIAERYRIEGAIGEGGYAVVYRVTDLAIQEPAALKLFVRGDGDPTALGRFKQEMRITRKLAHPNIVQVYEFGSWRDAYFITMELLYGMDLFTRLKSSKVPLPVDYALDIAEQAFAGLAEAHRQGVVHRDVKPRNLWLCEGTGRLKLMDFGIAKMTSALDGHTKTGQVVGTPAYIPPERLRSDEPELGASVDLYAMGVCMYQMLTKRLPLNARHIEALFIKILQERPVAPSTRNAKVPKEVDEFVLKLLEKDPADRFSTSEEAGEALAAIRTLDS